MGVGKRFWLALACLAGAGELRAVGGTAVDQAASLTYSSSHWDGSPSADFAGVETVAVDDVAAAGWFYRVEGLDTREHPFPPPDTETYALGEIRAVWNDVDGKGFRAEETTFVFDHEGPSGAFVTELLIQNDGPAPITIHVFHYLNGDLLGTAGGDNGLALKPLFLHFYEANEVLRYSAANAQHALVRPAGAGGVNAVLNDANADDFDGSGLPISGDWTAGFQQTSSVPNGTGYVFGPVVVSVNLPAPTVKGQRIFPGSGFANLATQDPVTGAEVTSAMRRTSDAHGASSYHRPNTRVFGLADFHGQLTQQFVDRDVSTGEVFIGSNPLQGAPTLALNWKIGAANDFNHDFKADLLWRNTASQKLVIWTMNGSTKVGSIIPSPDQAVDANWEVVGAADFDHDLLPDLLWYNQTSGKLVVWYMDQLVQRVSGGFTNPSSVGNNNWKAVAVGDFGKGPGGVWDSQDIVWQNSTSLKIVVWHMDHAGNRTAGVFTTPDSFGSRLVVGPR